MVTLIIIIIIITIVIIIIFNTVSHSLDNNSSYNALLCSDFPSALPGVYDQIVQETEKLLEARGLSQLTSQQRDMLKGQTEGITSPDSTVLNLISECGFI